MDHRVRQRRSCASHAAPLDCRRDCHQVGLIEPALTVHRQITKGCPLRAAPSATLALTFCRVRLALDSDELSGYSTPARPIGT
jgi:hypothetical protein